MDETAPDPEKKQEVVAAEPKPKPDPDSKPQQEPVAAEPEQEAVLTFLDDFTEYGYTEEQIEGMKTVLYNVGVVEITDLEVGGVSYGMQVVKGVAYKGKSLRGPRNDVEIQVNIENGTIYYIRIYCPWDNLDGLNEKSAELYYDTAGGYLKKIDWENKVVVSLSAEEIATLMGIDPFGVGATKNNPLVITADKLAEEIDIDAESAAQKYNNMWVKITGKITGTSDAGNMYGYYLYGKKGESGLRIICWCDDGPYSGSVKGDTQTFIGYLREVSTVDTTDIGGCTRIIE